MITINLRPGLKRKRSGRVTGAAVLEQLRGVGAKVKDPMLLLAAACWIAVLGYLGWSYVSTSRQLSTLQPQLEQARSEHRRFETFIHQKRRQEAIRDSLLAQIGVIRSVDGDRYVWPHILDEISKALPPYTWLVDIGLNGAPTGLPGVTAVATPAAGDTSSDSTAQRLTFQLTGRTVDIQAYTRFLRQLEASPWISDVTPVSAQTIVEHEHPVTAFVIRARFQRADSAYIRTVPLSQSVR